MRLFYFLLHVVLKYPLRIYYPKQVFINKPKKYFNRTIYVSNHAASFMDPLVLGILQRPSLFFMTRSDVFTKFTSPLLWLVQMLPIYRKHDGEDTKAKNEETFLKATRILSTGRNLLIFGEGFTDDVYIRRLKPIKKGAVRMGFEALEKTNWKKKIYVATIGINYGDPNVIGSNLLVSNGKSICLNDYRESYEENDSKTVHELTLFIEKDLQNQLIHVENLDWVFFHEHVSRLLRNGLHPADSDPSISVQKRWENGRRLAKWMNEQNLEENPELVKLKADLENYFSNLKKMEVEENHIFQLAAQKPAFPFVKRLAVLLGLPFSLLALIHFYVPYTLIKRFVEKSFKRRVFWSSVKMVLGTFAMVIWNIPIVIAMHHWIFKPTLIAFTSHTTLFTWIYFLIIPLFGVIAYQSFKVLKNSKDMRRIQKMDKESMVSERTKLIERIKVFYP